MMRENYPPRAREQSIDQLSSRLNQELIYNGLSFVLRPPVLFLPKLPRLSVDFEAFMECDLCIGNVLI